MGYFKRIFALINDALFKLHKRYFLWKLKLKQFFEGLYTKLKIDHCVYFFYFLFHRYHAKQFNPFIVSHNLKQLVRVHGVHWLDATKEGKLYLLTTPWQKRLFSLKNILLAGALQKRVERAIFFTYLTITIELKNPFDKKLLIIFLEKKLALLKHLLSYIKQVNGKSFDHSNILLHINLFHRSSLVQAEVIHEMQLAVKRSKDTELIKEVRAALKKGVYPLLVIQGMSGAYWMRGLDRQIVGLFKPFDEEIHAPNNPVGPRFQGALGHRKVRLGCRVGESAHHEVAAFLVDEFFGFGIVPRTNYAVFEHHTFFLANEDRMSSRRIMKTKIGSFQEYVEGFIPANKLSNEEWNAFPMEEFQLLVLLDVIIGNADRNIGNILFGDNQIAAIDHGLCFPETTHELSYWYWSAKQGQQPLYPSFIELLNQFPFDELTLQLRKKCFIALNALSRMRERIVLFTEAVNAGLVPSQLVDLFVADYLVPLMDRKTTLQAEAKKQITLYQATLSQ